LAQSATQSHKGGIDASGSTAFNAGLAGNEIPADNASTRFQ
jgi:hypothetical protein